MNFDHEAVKYRQRSQQGIWRWIRSIESQALLEVLGELRGKNVVDLCSGPGFYADIFLRRGPPKKLTCVDQSKEMLDQIPWENVHKIQADVVSGGWGDSYDLLFCAGGLEFLPSLPEFFKKCEESASPKAKLVLMTAPQSLFSLPYRGYHRLKGRSARVYDMTWVRELALQFGWQMQYRRRVHLYAEILVFHHVR